jgi:hypothetical protein
VIATIKQQHETALKTVASLPSFRDAYRKRRYIQ